MYFDVIFGEGEQNRITNSFCENSPKRAQKTRLGRVQLCFHSALRVLPAVFASPWRVVKHIITIVIYFAFSPLKMRSTEKSSFQMIFVEHERRRTRVLQANGRQKGLKRRLFRKLLMRYVTLNVKSTRFLSDNKAVRRANAKSRRFPFRESGGSDKQKLFRGLFGFDEFRGL